MARRVTKIHLRDPREIDLAACGRSLAPRRANPRLYSVREEKVTCRACLQAAQRARLVARRNGQGP